MAHPLATSTDEEAREFCRAVLRTFPRNQDHSEGADGEVWRQLASHPSYAVSSLGRVRRIGIIYGGGGSVRTPSGVLKQRPLPRGHLQVTLSEQNQPVTVLVHRLVAEAFLSAPAEGQDCVCHRDDDPANNRPDNLFWGSRADNIGDMRAKGRQARGERVRGAKLNAEQVREIRALLAGGANQYDVSSAFGVSQSNVSQIATRATWRHVP